MGFPWTVLSDVRTGRTDLLVRVARDSIPDACVQGTLVDEQGARVCDATIEYWRGDRGVSTRGVNMPWYLHFCALPAGRCHLVIRSDARGIKVIDDLTLTRGETLALGNVVMEPPGTFRITRGEIPRQPTLRVLTLDGAHLATLEPVDGVYRSLPLAPGEYLLQPWREPCVAVTVRSGVTDVELRPQATTRCFVRVVVPLLPNHADLVVSAFGPNDRFVNGTSVRGAAAQRDVELALPAERFRIEGKVRNRWRGSGELLLEEGTTPAITLELTRM